MDAFIQAALHGQWPIVAGIAIVFLVHLANQAGLKNKIGSAYVPWFTLLVSTLTSVGHMLATGSSFTQLLHNAVLTSAVATGAWELVVKNVVPAAPVAAPPAK